MLSESVPLVSNWKAMQRHFQADVEKSHQVWAQKQGGVLDMPGALLWYGNGDLHRQGDSVGMAGAGSHLGSLLAALPLVSCCISWTKEQGKK